MNQFNLQNSLSVEQNYQNGLLPQRNQNGLWYFESSSRSNLSRFSLSSENRRIFNKTQNFTFEKIPLSQFKYTPEIQKTIFKWLQQLKWNFPISSVKKIFTQHIFNYLYIWKDTDNNVAAYSVCYLSNSISHIAYVFYDPNLSHSNLPIRLVLQVIQDSADQKLKYCYLGRFSKDVGFYKRNMPGFEYFDKGGWIA